MLGNLKFFEDKQKIADILDLVIICIVTFIIAKLITTFVILNGHVPSGSMENTIMTGERIIANRLAYNENKLPQRGDIVVFPSPDDKANGVIKYYVKRVIGLPGETVEVKDGKVYINDTPIDEPYIAEEPRRNSGPYTVPEGHYFMMGDNRNHSGDSREWTHTYVPREDIIGKVVFKYSLNIKNLHFKKVESYKEYNI